MPRDFSPPARVSFPFSPFFCANVAVPPAFFALLFGTKKRLFLPFAATPFKRRFPEAEILPFPETQFSFLLPSPSAQGQGTRPCRFLPTHSFHLFDCGEVRPFLPVRNLYLSPFFSFIY